MVHAACDPRTRDDQAAYGAIGGDHRHSTQPDQFRHSQWSMPGPERSLAPYQFVPRPTNAFPSASTSDSGYHSYDLSPQMTPAILPGSDTATTAEDDEAFAYLLTQDLQLSVPSGSSQAHQPSTLPTQPINRSIIHAPAVGLAENPPQIPLGADVEVYGYTYEDVFDSIGREEERVEVEEQQEDQVEGHAQLSDTAIGLAMQGARNSLLLSGHSIGTIPNTFDGRLAGAMFNGDPAHADDELSIDWSEIFTDEPANHIG